MSMNRKGFFKTLFGGFVAASTIPSLAKAEETAQPPQFLSVNKEILRIDGHGNLGIGGSDNVGLGTSMPMNKLHVQGIIFHVNDRMLEMAGDENGDFKIHWLDTKENEFASSVIIKKPKDDLWKTNSIAIY
jgi:hypothetical protein